MDTSIVETKNVFFQMWQASPIMTILFWVFMLTTLALITIQVITKHNPGFFNNLLNKKNNNQPEKERRHYQRRKDDIQKDKTFTEQLYLTRKDIKEQFKTINLNIEELFSIITSFKQKLDKVSQGTLENILFSANRSHHDKMKAFFRLTAMAINGDVKAAGFKLAVEDKNAWRAFYKDLHHYDLEIIDKKYFDDTIAEINKLVFDGGIKI